MEKSLMLDTMTEIPTLPLTYVPHEVLRTPTHEISLALSDDIQALIPSMFATMVKERGVGLAATQIGRNIRLAVIDAEGQQFTLINPHILSKSKERVLFTEGCLSIPGTEFPIIRHEKITVRYLNAEGKQCKIKLRGFLAIVFQHEIDHLDGIVIEDRYNEQKELHENLH